MVPMKWSEWFCAAAILAAASVFALPARARQLEASQQNPLPAQQPAAPQGEAAAPSAPSSGQTEVDRRAEIYYQFSIARVYEEQYEFTGRADYAGRAIAAYRRAYELDPHSSVIGERLAEAFARAGRLPEAIQEAQDVIKRDPANLPARRILARIFYRSLDLESAGSQKELADQAIEQFREIVRLDSSDTDSALRLARLYRAEGNDVEAEIVLRDVLKRAPDENDALRQLAILLLESEGRASEAIAFIEPVAHKANSAEWDTLLGDAYAHAHDYPASEAACRAAVALQGDDVPARKCLGEALLLEQKYEAALIEYRHLTELEPNDPEHFLRLSLIYRRLGQLDKAEESLLRAKQDAPGSLEVIYNEALTYRAQGRFEDAIRVLSDAVAAARGAERPSTMAILYEQLGALFREVENYAAALDTFSELAALGPEHARRARELIIDTLRMSRQIDKALAESQKAIADYPDDRSFVMTRALLLAEKGDAPAGAALIQDLQRESPKDFELAITLAQVYERGRKFHEAEKAMADAELLAGRPADRQMVWFLRGAMAERQKKYDEAEEQFRRVLAADPHDGATLNYYGYMLADRGIRLEEAVVFIQRALAEEPYNGAYLDSLGWAYYKQSKFDDARKTLEHAVARTAHDPTVREHLGDVYLKLGRQPQALQEWSRAQGFWHDVLPADFEPERVAELNRKISQLKHEMAQTAPAAPAKP